MPEQRPSYLGWGEQGPSFSVLLCPKALQLQAEVELCRPAACGRLDTDTILPP